jgi:hypothetical protein
MRARVATLGHPGPSWPRAIARWGSTATLPLEATTCVTAEELRSLVTATVVDLAVVDLGLPGVDRSLADAVRSTGAALAVVDGPGLGRAGRLDADAVLPPDFDADALGTLLQTHRRKLRATTSPPPVVATVEAFDDLFAVTGPGGAGTSTIAQALATALGGARPTILADLALDADQHLRHAGPPDGDGLFELAEALRHQPDHLVSPPLTEQRGGYLLLRGLRRRQEWTALDAPLADRAVRVLRRHGTVVADLTADLDGRADTGSGDLEDRNGLARAAVEQATVVLVVGHGSTAGLHRLARTLAELGRHGVAPQRLQPVVNALPGRRLRRAAVTAGAGRLLRSLDGDWRTPVGVARDRRVEACVRDGRPLPPAVVRAVRAAVAVEER